MPALLAHLGIEHVSLACHSGGTVYGLDFALHHPEVLHPERPYIAIAAPWIRPMHTSSSLMSVVQTFPPGMLKQTDKLVKFITNYAAPSVGYVSGLSSATMKKLRSAPEPIPSISSSATQEGTDQEQVELERRLQTGLFKRIHAENIYGVSTDAMVLMQKDGDGQSTASLGWGDWGDYDGLVPRLAEQLRARGFGGSDNRLRLRVDMFYAESDIMVGDGGTKGPKWFDALWTDTDVFDYRSTTTEGTNHDEIWDLKSGITRRVLECVGSRSSTSSTGPE